MNKYLGSIGNKPGADGVRGEGYGVIHQPELPAQGVSTRSHPRERPARAITKTDFLPASVRVHFFCHRPWGTDDERSMVELPYADIRALPVLPVDDGHGEFRETWEESVYIRSADVTVYFRFAKWQETDDCRMEAMVGGPYLALAGGTTGRMVAV